MEPNDPFGIREQRLTQAPKKAQREPFNLTIFNCTKERLAKLRQVSVLDIYDGMSNTFHADGLFSVQTFGRVGSDERDLRFGYIDIKASIFHPLVFRRLLQLKGFYGKLMLGQAYAVWDEDAKDFTPAAADDKGAGTGFGFFISHWEDIVFERNQSLTRSLRIDFIEKFKSVAMTDKVLVMPAGLRDIETDETGRTTENEINEPYRKLIAVSNTLTTDGIAKTSPFYDAPRKSLQSGFNQIYEMIDQILYGKKGFVQGKWGSRRVFNGTRNVISSMETAGAYFGGPRSMSVTDTQLGLWQTTKSALPVTVHCLKQGWLSKVFGGAEQSAVLVNPKTLKPEFVDVDPETTDQWTTAEGLEKLVESQSEIHKRQRPIKINGYYLGLVYSDGKNFRVFNDIDELPEGFDRKNVHPLSLTTLIYLSGYRRWYELFTFVTRYPIAGMGSMYPSQVYCRTTMQASAQEELDHDWQPKGKEYVAREFPVFDLDAVFMDSQSPHPAFLKGLVADFDGDQTSADTVYIADTIEQVRKYIYSLGALIHPSGGLHVSATTDTIELVLRNLLSDVR